MIRGLDHIGIAVRNLDDAGQLWTRVAGAEILGRERVADQQVEVLTLQIGSLKIELLQPTSEASPVARFLETRGEGLHHVALSCDSVTAELNRLRSEDVRLIDRISRLGAEHSHVGFIHPHSLAGVLLEFVDHSVS